MSIAYAILGYLSWTPLTGYDLKKLFSESTSMYWSGNNNQIYRTLVELHTAGWVSLEVQHRDDHPSRKIYSITAPGRAALRDWVLSTPELPYSRGTFLVQLAWADQLSPAELDDLLARYEEEVRVQALMLREQAQRKRAAPDRTPREVRLWDAIAAHDIGFYEQELAWVRDLRRALAEPSPHEDAS